MSRKKADKRDFMFFIFYLIFLKISPESAKADKGELYVFNLILMKNEPRRPIWDSLFIKIELKT